MSEPPPAPVSGRTGGRGRGRNRYRGGRTGHGASGQQQASLKSVFKGTTADMNGNLFECYEEQEDRRQYTRTLEALEAYAKKNLKYAEDLAPLFAETMGTPKIDKPTALATSADDIDKFILQERLKEYVKRDRALTGNLGSIYAVAWGQCSEAMKSKLKAVSDYKDKSESNDCYWLLKNIKSITLQFDEQRDVFLALLDARTRFLNCKQKPGQTIDEYVETLYGWADAIEYHKGIVAENYVLIPDKDKDGKQRTDAERRVIARERTIATLMIRGADPTRYGTLITELSNAHAMGEKKYPTTTLAAYNMLVAYKTPTNAKERPSPQTTPTVPTTPAAPEASALTFAQRAAPKVAGKDGVTHDTVQCYSCQSMGHFANECPGPSTTAAPPATKDTSVTKTGTTLTQFAYMLTQASHSEVALDPNWILLDSQSTISVFCNPHMLSNIRESGRVLRAITNGGYQESTLVGDFPNLGEVWYNSASIANILSLADVRKVCRVTMDSASIASIDVHRLDGSVMRFEEHPSGLYVYKANHGIAETVAAYTMISTVSEQKKFFSPRDIRNADLARDLYRKLGRPAEADFQLILRRNLIRNCPVTPDDAQRALMIYGPDVATLKGKMTRTAAAAHVPSFAAVPIPAPVLELHRKVTLCVDFFFVQGLCFLHTISRNVGFRTVSLTKDRNKATMLRELAAVIHIYTVRGFDVVSIHADHEFACLQDDLRPIAVDIVPPDSHVGEVERSIRTIKERLRSCVHGLPFKRLPRLLLSQMVSHSVHCLNQFPWRNGISRFLSPANLVLGTPAPDYNHMTIEFGAYAQVFEDATPSNTPRSRSLGAIALTPTGNAQGDFNFLSLASGERISRHQWTALPMTDTAIARVEALAIQDGMPLIQERGLVVEWRPDQPIDDAEYDLDFVAPDPDPVDDLFDDDDYDPIHVDELLDLQQPDPNLLAHAPLPAPVHQGAHGIIDDVEPVEQPVDGENIEPDDYDSDIDEEEEPIEGEEDNDDEPGAQNAQNEEDLGAQNAQELGAQNGANQTYNLRPRIPRTTFREAMDNPHDGQSYYPPATINTQYVVGFVMTQMTAKAGIKKHGEAAKTAIMEEYAQLESLNVYTPIDPTTLTADQRKGALRAINLVKEKRDGRLKGRTVADGRSQRSQYDRSETASPTVSSEALALTVVVDAHEKRDVATADIAGAYLKADMVGFVLMKFTGESVELLCRMNSKHAPFVTTENGIKVLYVRLDKAIYGCVTSALLWYHVYLDALEEMGFKLNPYDACVANSIIDGKQCTIAWYVDDMKISHTDPEVVTSIINQIESKFGKMTVTRGTEHVFLGMKIKYNGDGTATIDMAHYLQEAIDESKMDIKRTVATPAKRTLFEVDEDATPLPKDEAERFHSVVAKLLYVATRARVDLLLAVGFLCTRVSKCTVEDAAKLKRLLEYIKGTIGLQYTIGADELTKLRTWVDASYAVHPDMKSHTGGVMSLGVGGLACKSTKQKLNTKSSTEAELVGASDYLPNTIWVKMFLEAQGYKIDENILEQDNESAIKLEKNGRASAGPRSRHIDIRYFWIKDRCTDAEIAIRHCPTLQMLADFFTKPLQGSLFATFRDVLLGYKHIRTLAHIYPLLTVEERVEENIRADERGTEEKENDVNVDDDGFTIVRKKVRKRSSDAVEKIALGKIVSGAILSKQSS